MREDVLIAWYEDYGESVLTYILLMVHDYQQAEDLTQETFLKAYRKQHTFTKQSSVKTWLFAIAHNTTIDFFRKKHPLQYFFDFTLKEVDTTPLPEQLIALSYQNEQLYSIIQNLKLSYRQVIILRKLKDFSTKEAAEILNWSDSKVKMTLKRGLEELKDELIKGGFEFEAYIR